MVRARWLDGDERGGRVALGEMRDEGSARRREDEREFGGKRSERSLFW